MSFLTRHIQLYLAAERARLRYKTRNTVIRLVMFLFAGILFVFAAGFALFAIYSLLTQSWTPWQAALAIAGIAGAIITLLLMLVFKQSPPAVEKEVVNKIFSTSPENSETESALRLGEAVGKSVKRCRPEPGDLVVAALLVGIVLGVSPLLRGTRQRKNNERKKSEDI